ncbi:MAG TPA: hypothetical protein ENF28_00725 [Proteobacteria bacterium]|nr:hypothetical protein [Pseudomonadota bacterium]
MPGFDGTGPQGMGPMTGGRRGYCATGVPGPYSYGPRFGGWNRGVPGMPYGRPQAYGYDPQTELQFLQQQATGWRQNLEQLEVRIKQLEDQLQQKQQAD